MQDNSDPDRTTKKVKEKVAAWEGRKRVMIDNIKEELETYKHDFPALRTVYLILKGMRV